MNRRSKALIAGAGIAAVGVLGTGAAVATGAGGDDANETETPIPSGTDLDRASAAALAHTGGGRVSETEVGDEESYYEVEVTLDNGDQVDVQLDKSYNVVGDKTERGGESEAGER